MHPFNLSTHGVKALRLLDSRPAWSTKQVPGYPELQIETLTPNNNNWKSLPNSPKFLVEGFKLDSPVISYVTKDRFHEGQKL